MKEVGDQAGFTLLEVLVAMAIAATALVTLMSRLGASSDVQRDLALHALALSEAVNRLEAQRLLPAPPNDETHGRVRVGEVELRWHGSAEKTQLAKLVRENMEVKADDEPPVRLFLYRMLP